MGISFNVEDNSREVLEEFKRNKERALENIGNSAVSYATLLCPWRTGNLSGKIDKRVVGDSVYIGTNVYYAPYVEFGHTQEPGRYVPAIGKRLVSSYVPPMPFIKPAVTEHMEEYKSIAEQYLKGG